VIIRLLTVYVLITVLFAGNRKKYGINFVSSGQTVCQGTPEHPCYKIAYFRDVSSRVAFREAQHACDMDGGSLLSIENTAEQKHIEHLLGSGITDGDFWIGLTRVEDETAQEPGNFASCPNLYRWTDGCVSQFRDLINLNSSF
uniref:Chondrolectin n=1 Tax=Cyprinus carpio TaxID=7962 RepID=A0A8C1Q2N1_CYPCA